MSEVQEERIEALRAALVWVSEHPGTMECDANAVLTKVLGALDEDDHVLALEMNEAYDRSAFIGRCFDFLGVQP